jgi:hypothetical protein
MIAHRAYRALPKELRLRLIEQLPPQRRLWLVRRLTQTPRRRSGAQVGSVRRVRDRGDQISARVVTEATPLGVWQTNLDEVTQTLDEAGIEYFYLRRDDLRSAVAVLIEHKSDVLRLLTSAPRLRGAEVRGVNAADEQVELQRPDAIVQVFRPVTDPFGETVLGSAYACEIEFWRRTPGVEPGAPATITGPRPNAVAHVLPAEGETRTVPAALLNNFVPAHREMPAYRTRAEFAVPPYDFVTFPIDAVYTWVDGNDADWRQRKNRALAANGHEEINQIAANDSRYVSRDELRYSLRSITSFAPWIRQIFLVTDDQVPAWLDVNHPMIKVVPHREIFGDTGVLPTFNSHAIESRLHRIPGLAEHFLYVNDDMFFGRPLKPTTFFHANGIAKFFTSPAQLDAGPATVYDAPVTAAGKNNRRHIEEIFGRTIAHKMRHVPYPLRKSVLEEIEQRLPEEVLNTAAHQFRHPQDLSIPSSLQHYWGYLSGRSVPGSIKYTYADLAHPSTPVQLAYLLSKRHCDVFCLNDTDSAEASLAEQHAMLNDFLPLYFPFRAPFELPDDVTAERARRTATQLARADLGGTAPAATAPAPRQAEEEPLASSGDTRESPR